MSNDQLTPLTPEEFKHVQAQMKRLIEIRNDLLQLADVVKETVPVRPEETVEPVQMILTTMIGDIVQKVKALLGDA